MRALWIPLALTFGTPALAAPGARTQEAPSVESAERVSSPRDQTRRKPRGGEKKRAGKGKRRGKKKERVKIDAVNPLHGVLLYGPKLGTHDKYANAENRRKPTVVKPKHLPERDLDRSESVAVGVVVGSLMHGYQDGTSHSDLGVGLKGRYRPVEFIGLELGLQRHGSQLLGGDRGQMLISGSVDVFAFPWNTLSPYAVAGLTLDSRANHAPRMGAEDPLTGAHLGLGLEYAIRPNVALDVEARALRWLDRDVDDLTNPGAVMLTGGVVFHF